MVPASREFRCRREGGLRCLLASVPIFAETSFDPGTIDIMNKAYGHACRMLHDKGQPAVCRR
jgi:hypothetical protein